jgi:hypothetical protein
LRGLLRAVGPGGLAALAALWVGCGGGSPSDVVLPEDVDVTLEPIGTPAAHDVGFTLGGKDGREITLMVAGTGLAGATGVAFELHYDPDFLDFVSASSNAFFGSGSVSTARPVQGAAGVLVGVAAATDQTTGRNGSGALVTLRFRLRELRDGETDLIFGVPQSLVYAPAGVAGEHTFTGGRLVTRIRAPL